MILYSLSVVRVPSVSLYAKSSLQARKFCDDWWGGGDGTNMHWV